MADIKSKLILDNTQFNKAAKTSKKLIGGLGAGLSAVGGVAKVASVALLGAATALGGIIAVSTNTIDRLGKVAKTTGFAAKTLQQFQFAAEQSGVSSDNAALALRRFSRRLGEAQKGTGELLPALKKLGINVKDGSGNFKSAEQVLFEFADGLADTKDSTARLALAFKAFDSEGAELVTVLKDGSDGLNEFFDEAERLGFLLTADSIKGVEKFKDEFNKLSRVIGGVVNQTVAALAETLEDLTVRLTEFLLKLIDSKGGSEKFGKYLKDIILSAVEKTIEVLETLINTFIDLFNLIRAAGRNLDIEFGLSDADVKRVTALKQELEDLPRQRGFNFVMPGIGALAGTAKQIMDGFVTGFEDPVAARAITDQIEEIYKDIEKVDFGGIMALLVGNKEKAKEDTQEIVNGIEEVLVTAQPKFTKAVAFLDKLFGEDLVNRWLDSMDEMEAAGKDMSKTFSQSFFEEMEIMLNMLEEVGEKVKLRLGTPMERLAKTLEDGLVKSVDMFEDALANAILTGKADFSSLGDHIKQVLAKALVQKFISAPILKMFGLPGLASGGPAKAGQPYVVGEEGPELFIPKNSGTVIPNDETMAMAGGAGLGGGTTVNYNINAVDAKSFKQLVSQDPEFIFNVSQAGARRVPG